jgi:hypothetical protein
MTRYGNCAAIPVVEGDVNRRSIPRKPVVWLSVLLLSTACTSEGKSEGDVSSPSTGVSETVVTTVAASATTAQRALPLVGSGGSIEPSVLSLMTVESHCGVRYLGELNGLHWLASDPESVATDWIPTAWPQNGESSTPLRVELLLAQDGASIQASNNGYTVTYLPTDEVADDVRLCV